MPHHRCTWTNQSYSPGGANVHPPFNTRFLEPNRVHVPNGISISSAIFAQLTATGRYTLRWDPLSPIKIAPFVQGFGSPSNTWLLGPTRVYNPNGILVSSVVFAQFTVVTARQTDIARSQAKVRRKLSSPTTGIATDEKHS